MTGERRSSHPSAEKPGNAPDAPRFSWRRVIAGLGPGLITGASDDDPSGIGTYAAAGASLGYAPLWMAWVTFPLMAAIQYTCAKIGLVTGKGIAGVLREHYPRPLLYVVVVALLVVNSLNAGVDILAIAAGINLLAPVPTSWLVVPIGAAIVLMQAFGNFRMIASIFKWLTLALFAYVASAFFAKPDWSEVLRGTLVPTFGFDAASLAIVVGILGTTISPYLFFWQATHEVESHAGMHGVSGHRRRKLWRVTDTQLRYAAWDVNIGMLFSNLVMFFIILSTAATLHQSGVTEIQSAAQAAEALRPIAGDAATILMALGLIGTGVLAVPILTGSAGYALCEAFGWRCSLDLQPGKAKEFYWAIGLSTLGGLAIDFVGINPMKALLWIAVINGFLAPPLLFLILRVANNRNVMGERVNGWGLNVLGWTTTLLMSIAAVALALTWNAP